jgi:sensor histidine kinase YesM
MRKVSMHKWLLIQFCVIIIVPSIVIFFFANYLYVSASIDQQVRSKILLLDEYKRNIDTKLKFLQQMSLQFYLNEGAMAEIGNDTPAIDCERIQAQLDSYVNSNPYIANAYLYSAKGTVSSGHGITGMDRINADIQSRLLGFEGKTCWHFAGKVKSLFGMEQYGTFGSRHIRKDWKPIATLHIGLRDTFFFGDFFGGINSDLNQPFFVCTRNGVIIASSGSSLSPGTELFNKEEFLRIVSGPQPYSYANVETGDESLVLTVTSVESGWVIATFLYPREISDSIRVVRNIFSVTIPLFALFLLLLSFVLTSRFSRPLRDLSATMANIGNEIRELPVDDSQVKEIQLLCESFNTMTERIKKLMEDAKTQEKEKRRAYVQTLQLQLTPHFLYNALNTIGWMAEINGQENIREITRALISFLKEVSAIDSGFVQLGKELDLLSDYAVIQRYRYTDFELSFDVPDELRSLFIHKMMLVNLMENSIIHGFRDRNERNTIRVHAERRGKRLTILFEDNGSGFNPEELRKRPRSQNASIGLRNTQKRIRLYHGHSYGLKIESEPGEGCRITISLPVMNDPPR